MVERVGVLVVSYGSRAAAIVDALKKSTKYDVRIYDADKQRNPFILSRAEKFEITGNDIEKISNFAEKYTNDIDFGIVGPENPIIDGVRDKIEGKLEIPMICPTKEFAIEESKVFQRILMKKCCPDANPRFRVFDPSEKSNDIKKEVWNWLDELDNQAVVKPDKPAVGKGVGVWGDHFNTREELYEHFLSIYRNGKVIIEEKITGEEFSLQFFSDGKRIIPSPCVRDYKRAFDGDLGPNTGGMGAYKDKGDILPFMSQNDWDTAIEIGNKIFNELKEKDKNNGMRGIPFYMAYICTKDGIKVLEINSRPGDPEIINILPIIKNDYVDTCYDMINGNLTRLEFEKKATVLTYSVPMTYGGYRNNYSNSYEVDLSKAEQIKKDFGENLKIYPGSMEIRNDNKTYALKSRVVCTVGISDEIETARQISLKGIKAIDGALWNRMEIASSAHIENSIRNMKNLRLSK